MKPVQRIMVRTAVSWRGLAARRVIEHPTQRYPVHDTTVHAETHDAPCPLCPNARLRWMKSRRHLVHAARS